MDDWKRNSRVDSLPVQGPSTDVGASRVVGRRGKARNDCLSVTRKPSKEGGMTWGGRWLNGVPWRRLWRREGLLRILRRRFLLLMGKDLQEVMN